MRSVPIWKNRERKNTNNLSLTDAKYDIHIQRVISRFSGHYRESPTRASIYRRNNSSENSPRIGCINHFVGHRSDHVVAPFHRLDSAPPDRTPRFFSRSTNFRCIGLKISLIFAVSLKKSWCQIFFFFQVSLIVVNKAFNFLLDNYVVNTQIK